VLFHGIVRRRLGRLAAVATTAVLATAPLYLVHTDQLLTELPFLAAVALFVWWYDRIRSTNSLLSAPLAQLVVLGCLVAVAFNVRREAIALVAVVAVMQIVDLVAEQRHTRRATLDPADWWRSVRGHGRALIAPHLAAAVSVVLFQLLLPTALLPDNDNKLSYVDDRLREYPAILSTHVGLGDHTLVGVAILLVAVVGAVVGVRQRPALDGILVALAAFSALAISTHLREVTRYWMQVTPWVVYFVTVALVAAGRAISVGIAARRARNPTEIGVPHNAWRRDVVRVVVLAPLFAVIVAHGVVLVGDVSDARDYNDAGRVLSGPTNPTVAPIYTAVDELTRPDSIVAYFRARTMTLLTDRLSFQTKNLDRIAANADYFAQRRNSTYWQPTLSLSQARLMGWTEVWSDANWVLWQIPDDAPS
jgi:hypothetical protein